MERRIVAVIGPGTCDDETAERAREVGERLAGAGCVVLTGGLGGVMEAASKGAREAGGLTVGILPDARPETANPFVELAIATGLGEARNVVLVNTAEALIAVGGGYGTLSEIALALRSGKRVVSLGSWEPDAAVRAASSPEEAVAVALDRSVLT